MKRPLVAAAVLCVLAAQPASAAWQTSAPGTAKAKAATVGEPTGVSCSRATRVIKWTGDAPGYEVAWSDKANGNGAKDFTEWVAVTASPYTVSGGVVARARVRAVAGTWSSEYVQTNCS
ncbi:hypothetical protein [Lentzea sp. HUAS12]|uniref:hypothetical protein n=1 Tax=Lentzea sp. HUAS12 TaxID=2951806 RepID=UPI00209F7979|nr:hypothetical protein [Lentzea sp. HUAS12]USX51982.1 hypothetical protein ND450_42775 [Lentzea sp. HUAS12]